MKVLASCTNYIDGYTFKKLNKSFHLYEKWSVALTTLNCLSFVQIILGHHSQETYETINRHPLHEMIGQLYK